MEDDYFLDATGGRSRLAIMVGCRFKADGMVIAAMRLAQKFWYPKRVGIPREVWASAGLGEEMIQCGIVSSKEGWIYLYDSERHFGWLFNQSKAGKSSADKARERKAAREAARIKKRNAARKRTETGSTPVEPPLNHRSTGVEPPLNHRTSSLLLAPYSSLISLNSEEPTHGVGDNSENETEKSGFRVTNDAEHAKQVGSTIDAELKPGMDKLRARRIAEGLNPETGKAWPAGASASAEMVPAEMQIKHQIVGHVDQVARSIHQNGEEFSHVQLNGTGRVTVVTTSDKK